MAISRGGLRFDDYQNFARRTDQSRLQGDDRLRFFLLGLFGEIGSLLSELKKKQRDRNAYFAYANSSLEETGDVLWYLANVANELDIEIADLAREAANLPFRPETFEGLQRQNDLFLEPASLTYVQKSLLRLASLVGRLVSRFTTDDAPARADLRSALTALFAGLISATTDAHISLDRAARQNMTKIIDRWPLKKVYTPLFDEAFEPDEQLPRRLEILFREKEVRGTKYVVQSANGISLGDRLTDNSAVNDDYRFHDVFHLGYAAILGWSPVLRALLRVKRKSDRALDEQEDGARAIITEEGISNWVFAHGQRHNDFSEVDSVDFSLLKSIREMVRGYEVEACPHWMWEEAILQSFACFRNLKANRGGYVVADLTQRSLKYREAV